MNHPGPSTAGALEFESGASVTRSIVGLMRARDVHLTGAAAGLVAAKGNLSIQNGGTQAVLAAGDATIGPKAFVGFVVSPKVTVAEGGRVLFGSPQSLAFGAAAGIAYAVLSRLVRR